MEKVIFNNGKRVSARGIIISCDKVYLMFRRRKNDDGSYREYYVVPGGGIDEGEDELEAVKRELKEEFSVDVNILGKVGCDEGDASIANFYSLEIISGSPLLGGEEKEKCSDENYYEIRLVDINKIDEIDVTGKDYILKAYKKEYIN